MNEKSRLKQILKKRKLPNIQTTKYDKRKWIELINRNDYFEDIKCKSSLPFELRQPNYLLEVINILVAMVSPSGYQ